MATTIDITDETADDGARDPAGPDPAASDDRPSGHSPHQPSRARRRPRLRWFLLGVAAVVVAYGAYCAVRILDAAGHLRAGMADVQHIKDSLPTADFSDPHVVDRLTADLRAATNEFARAHAEVDAAALDPLVVLPYAGRQVRSVDALSAAAVAIGSAADHTLSQARLLSAERDAAPSDRARMVAALASGLASLTAAIAHADPGPSAALLPQLASGRNKFVHYVAQLQDVVRRARGASSAIAGLLGGHQTYLVFAGNNAEMRDGSAMFLQAGTLQGTDGQLQLSELRSTQDLASGAPLAPMAPALAARWGALHPNEDYRNLGLSPQFALNAQLAAAMWQQQTGQKVDGVLSLDVAALKALLAVTGPVSTGPVSTGPASAGGVTVDATDVESYLFVTQYRSVTSSTANANRRDELGNLADAVLTAAQRPGVPLRGLVSAFADAANGRHLLAWSADRAVDADWNMAGASGRLGPHDLLLGTINKGVNKLDPYQHVDAQIRTTPAGGDTRVTVTAHLRNDTPAGLPPYVAGGNVADAPAGYYTGALALDLPAYAGDASVRGGDGIAASGRDGASKVLAATISVPPGGSVTVVWTFSIRGHTGTLQIDPSARVPSVRWSSPTGTFTDATAHTVRW